MCCKVHARDVRRTNGITNRLFVSTAALGIATMHNAGASTRTSAGALAGQLLNYSHGNIVAAIYFKDGGGEAAK